MSRADKPDNVGTFDSALLAELKAERAAYPEVDSLLVAEHVESLELLALDAPRSPLALITLPRLKRRYARELGIARWQRAS